MSKEAAKAHSVLHYIISRAVLEGKEMDREFSLSLHDLQNEFEDVNFETQATNVMLRIKIQTTWDAEDDLVPLEELIGDIEDEIEDGTGPAEPPNKNKKGH